jgi:hypothetical protein
VRNDGVQRKKYSKSLGALEEPPSIVTHYPHRGASGFLESLSDGVKTNLSVYSNLPLHLAPQSI